MYSICFIQNTGEFSRVCVPCLLFDLVVVVVVKLPYWGRKACLDWYLTRARMLAVHGLQLSKIHQSRRKGGPLRVACFRSSGYKGIPVQAKSSRLKIQLLRQSVLQVDVIFTCGFILYIYICMYILSTLSIYVFEESKCISKPEWPL
jgi:hypothetical protein